MIEVKSSSSRVNYAYVILKGRRVSQALLDFVSQILAIELPLLDVESDASLTIRDIFHPTIWCQLGRQERRAAGLCLSWLVDRGHTPLVKLPVRRGKTLSYQLNTLH